MTRVKRGVSTHRRHRKMVKAAKGFRGMRSTNFRQAKNAVMKAGMNSYRDRRGKKRTFRQIWITRINSACRAHGIAYSRFINGLQKKAILIDRKMLADLAVTEPEVFAKLVEESR